MYNNNNMKCQGRVSIIRRSKQNLIIQQSLAIESHVQIPSVQNSILDILSPSLNKGTVYGKKRNGSTPCWPTVIHPACRTDCQPTPTSLVHWDYKLHPKCPLCDAPYCKVKHVLSEKRATESPPNTIPPTLISTSTRPDIMT